MADCSLVLQQPDISFLLHHNADVLWFILVPHREVTEFYQLSETQQKSLCTAVNLVSQLIDEEFDYHKINVATIGNVVSQMHIHVVGRRRDDPYWPGVVWGQAVHRQHNAEFIEQVRLLLNRQ